MAGRTSLSATIARLSLSLRVQLVLLAAISLTVPVLLYGAFQNADREKDALVLDAVRGQDVVIAKALAPMLTHIAPSEYGAFRAWCEEVDRALGQRATVSLK